MMLFRENSGLSGSVNPIVPMGGSSSMIIDKPILVKKSKKLIQEIGIFDKLRGLSYIPIPKKLSTHRSELLREKNNKSNPMRDLILPKTKQEQRSINYDNYINELYKKDQNKTHKVIPSEIHSDDSKKNISEKVIKTEKFKPFHV